jgi:hypothetical protein
MNGRQDISMTHPPPTNRRMAGHLHGRTIHQRASARTPMAPRASTHGCPWLIEFISLAKYLH